MKIFNNWKKKKLSAKISDIIFILFFVALLIPGPRKQILATINSIKAKIIQPKEQKNAGELLQNDYLWQIYDINGNAHYLDEYKNKVIFLNFWATWCGPCLGEMPEIQKLYDIYKNNENVQFLIISNQNFSEVKNFINKTDYTFPIFISAGKTPIILNTDVIPTSFLIDKNGKIIFKKTGVANWSGKKMQNIINNALK